VNFPDTVRLITIERILPPSCEHILSPETTALHLMNSEAA